MDPSERLAALLAGDLDDHEREALEDELARDPGLRASLSAMRRADERLRELSPVAPRAGFEERLDAALSGPLGEILASDPAATSDAATSVRELAPRRHRERRLQALVGVAAGAVVLAGGGVLLAQLTGNGADEEQATSAMSLEIADEPGVSADTEAADPPEEARARPAIPPVVAEDRLLDDADLEALLASDGRDAPALDDTAGHGALQLAPTPEEAAPPGVTTRDGRPLEEEESADLARCLDERRQAAPDAVVVYAELARYQDAEVVVLGLLTTDDTGDERTELWVHARPTCEVLSTTAR